MPGFFYVVAAPNLSFFLLMLSFSFLRLLLSGKPSSPVTGLAGNKTIK